MSKDTTIVPFTGYQKLVIFILAITQFTVILDFMVMSPMGDMLMKSMGLTTTQFGMAVSAYAISAGASGLLTAGFADRFDRKKLLQFFYIGFIIGTVFCGLATNYAMLIAARIFTGIFGGVIGSISMAIITDIFDIHHRGRVMGFLQMGFGASQVLGIPISLYIANHWGWQTPFFMVAGLGAVVALVIATNMAPVTGHLHAQQQQQNAFSHLVNTISKRTYRMGFLTTALLSLGGFMMMPFGSAFAINNLGVTNEQLPLLFMITGISTLVIMPLIGRMSDKIDKLKLFVIASVWMSVMVALYTNLSMAPFWLVCLTNILMMMGVMARVVPATALTTAIPDLKDRGAFMSINASLQQIAGGVAAAVAGKIVVQNTKTSPIQHYDTLGYIMIAITAIALYMLYRVNIMIKERTKQDKL